ncbi:MAG: hypothetical protein ABJA82_14425 [Myxococcales bacterium]
MRTYSSLASSRYPVSARALLTFFLVGAAGCASPGAAQQTPAVAGPLQAAPLPATVTFQGDVAPIRALTTTADGTVWIGSDRGLRRLRSHSLATEWIGAAQGLVGTRVSALATDATGRVLVATDVEVGRFSEAGGRLRYQSLAKLAGMTHLAPLTRAVSSSAATSSSGTWAGGPAGLFFLPGEGTPSPVPPVSIEGARGVPVISLDVDSDARSAWAGLAGRGLVQVDARRVLASFGPQGIHPLDFTDPLGTALLPNGTRISIGGGAQSRTHVLVLRRTGPELLTADVDLPLVALIAAAPGSGEASFRAPLLLGGPAATPRAYHLEVVERGEVSGPGLVRFTPAHKNLRSLRLIARPDPRVLPPDVTVAASMSPEPEAVLVGTRSLGVARVTASQPEFLPGGELASGATGLSVACLEQDRCVFATGVGPGWVWDGGDRVIKAIPDDAIGGSLMALAGDGRSNVYFITGGADKTLKIARLSSDGASWEPLLTLPVAVEGEGAPAVTFATLSPQGNLWMSIRDRSASGQESGRGVLEVQLPAGRAIHHRPYRQGEPRPPEAIPISGDVNAIRFQKGVTAAEPQAIWFCTSLGVFRFVGGQLSHWGENEGLDSETCNDLAFGPDGTVWVATAAGVAYFDGKGWRRLGSDIPPGAVASKSNPSSAPGGMRGAAGAHWPMSRDGESLPASALVISGETLWAGTARGLWPISTVRGPSPIGGVVNRASGLIDDEVFDLVTDRFGRMWVLGRIGLTIRRP